MTASRNIHTYLVTQGGSFFSCHGADREKIVAEELADGGQVLLHFDFPLDATEKDTQAFGRGVFEGYNAAMADVRSTIGRTLRVRPRL